MSGLIFPFKELIDECEAIKAYAADFLDKTTIGVLAEAKGTLDSIRVARHMNSVKWQIPVDRPLCTIWSDGECQPDGESSHKVRAEFSFVWQIRRINEGKWTTGKHFLLDGLASTVTTIVADVDGDHRVIARWATEVGDHASPGTHFHFQVNRPDSEELPFPKSLDIPRLPAPMMSPFLVIDLALGELFQDRWKKHSLAENKDSKWWRAIHQERLLRFFRWQTKCVHDFAGSPWMALKLAKPPREMLVEGT
ncbi:MAG: hypothetical protein Q8S73_28735 [Deltaproteobacteria bacterium]|nr:hypothetical protein [Myxococcales bacterium]MDP3218127.1 hypothetical protein [Deltaproteobacteria bacterium]